MNHLEKLNNPQREAVETTDGAVLVLAGAGTGKTRVLTTRIAHLLMSNKCRSWEILAVTFTNKAAKEMKNRVYSLIPQDIDANGIWLGTFHSIAARILRRHAEIVGLNNNYTILNSDDSLRLLKTIMKENNIDDKIYSPKIIINIIGSWKDRALLPANVTISGQGKIIYSISLNLYEKYQTRLIRLNACDFGDLLLHNLTIFNSYPEILRQYSHKYRYILVDEYQDTNSSQYRWLRLLASTHGNICCVGDDDQSIYGWRGADVGNILKFEKEYAGAKIIRLEQNYRSTPYILATASAIIANNKDRLGKTLWTDDISGEKIKVKSVWDDMEEARYIIDEIETLQRAKIPLKEIAILVRAGFQTRNFEERFLTTGMPYKVIGGLRFYERMEIRDAVAYLRFTYQIKDDLAFERIVNTPKRAIGKSTLETLHIYAREKNISLGESMEELLKSNQIKGKAKITLAEFCKNTKKWREIINDIPVSKMMEQILLKSGYIEMWKKDKSPESAGRLENLRELLRALNDFPDINDFMEHVSLVMDMDANISDDMVSVMTLHASKGLEFNAVFLSGWEEGIFPHQRAIDEKGKEGLEEERRLAYVGITRAREKLYITHASRRRVYNQWQNSSPSRFLGELPLKNIEIDEIISRTNEDFKQLYNNSETSTTNKTNNNKLKNKRIFHSKFGYGKVIAENGKHLEIAFEKTGRKKLMRDFIEIA